MNMNIKQISVSGLFGNFNHIIPLNIDERITIIHGPNGFGKTTMLRMLSAFFNSQYSVFWNTPFEKFKVEFIDDSSVEVIKAYEHGKSKKEKEESISFNPNGLSIEDSSPWIFSKKSISDNFVNNLDEMVPGIHRTGVREWTYIRTGEILSLEEVAEKFSDFIPQSQRNKKEPTWLKNLKNETPVRLIESQRLLNGTYNRSLRSPEMVLTVSTYSKEIAEIIQSKLADYGKVSQSLDRTFPSRVVSQKAPILTTQELIKQLDDLEVTRARLIEVGLLDKGEISDFQIPTQSIDDSTKNILSVYIEDVEKKLDVFSDIASKIELLRKIINSKFAYSYKQINFNKENGFVFKALNDSVNGNQETLSPKNLSSGEQHELVLFYELLFKVELNTLVLIDEPELSLHVGWQEQFLKDLQEITELAKLNVLMATHSPDIIQDRWDLTVELKGLGK
jgi:predicted ATP-binding protein involved in virulence